MKNLLVFKARTVAAILRHLGKGAEGMVFGGGGFRNRFRHEDVFLAAYYGLNWRHSLKAAKRETCSLARAWDLSKIEG